MLTASFSHIKPSLPGIAEQQLGQRHCPQVSVDTFISRFPEKVVWGSGYSETRRAAVVLELRKESLKSSSVCAANFYSVSRICHFLVIYSLVSTPAPQGLLLLFYHLPSMPQRVGGCYSTSATPCFSKQLSWQMPKGTLCLSRAHIPFPAPVPAKAFLPLLLMLTKCHGQLFPAASTLSS